MKDIAYDKFYKPSRYRILSVLEAAKYLGIHKETMRRLAAGGDVPAAKIGRSWRFIEQDLATHVQSLYSSSASQSVVPNGSKEIWHSTKETKSTGLISTTMVRDYNKALGLVRS